MMIPVQTISSHPLLIRAVEKTLHRTEGLCMLPSVSDDAALITENSPPRLFLLDSCSLHLNLGPLAARCRAHFPGSKFLALLAPAACAHPEEVELFEWGIDGFVELRESWSRELLHAIEAVRHGRPWVPPEVLLAFVARAKALLDRQLTSGQFLTAREGQVLQLLMRRFANKEISCTLGISERTAKFHVSNILAKLQLDGRHSLPPAMSATQALPT